MEFYFKKYNFRIDLLALDLVNKMLKMNPNHRISAEDALKHKYFSEFPYCAEIVSMPKVEKECRVYIL